MTKRCSRCKEDRPLDEFTRDRQAPDGLNRRCRPCKTQMSREYSRSESRKRYHRQWRAANRERVNELARLWREANHAEHLESKRKWREANPDFNKAYHAANRDAGRTRSQKRRALQLSATVGEVDLEALWAANGGRCQLCGDLIDRSLAWPNPMSASLDHIVPLSKGGTHEQSNLQWTHLVENIRKGARVAQIAL